jgi:uncharacterized protein (DUF305 family)
MKQRRAFRPESLRPLEDRLALSQAAAALHAPAHVVQQTAAPGRTAAGFEIGFLEGMIPHHQMAIRMSEIAVRNASDPEVRVLARRIIREQTPEIREMQSWLSAWYGIRGYRATMSMADMQMLQDLRALHGPAFDQAYLSDMIDHHQRAISGDDMMAGANQALDRAFHPRLLRLAAGIVATQSAEIQEMQSLLDRSGGMTPMS